MGKLIVETEMNGIPECCGLCDPLFMVACATNHDQTIDKMMLRVGRPSWCPIKGVLPEHHGRLGDLDELAAGCDDPYWCRWLSEIEDAPTIIPAERKDDER